MILKGRQLARELQQVEHRREGNLRMEDDDDVKGNLSDETWKATSLTDSMKISLRELLHTECWILRRSIDNGEEIMK